MQRTLKHYANPAFWECYQKLPAAIQKLADENFKLIKKNPKHPSLHLKKVGRLRSARVGRKYRVLAVEVEEGFLWFWIGKHAEYDKLIQ